MVLKFLLILGGILYAGMFGVIFYMIGKEVEGLKKDSEDYIKRMRGEK